MFQPDDPNSEMLGLIDDERAPDLLKQALRLFSEADPTLARDVADQLDEICERRWAATHTGLHSGSSTASASSRDLDAEVLNERCDALTGRLMKYLGGLVIEGQASGSSRIVLVAGVRALICTSVSLSGVETGLKDVQSAFEDALEELAPLLRAMPEGN